MKVSELIKSLRAAKDMPQQSLSEKSGVPLATVRGIEQDKRQPSWATLQRLAKALGASLGDFDGCDLAEERATPKKVKRKARPYKFDASINSPRQKATGN